MLRQFCLSALIVATVQALPRYQVTMMGTPSGANRFEAYGMNNLGQVVGSTVYNNGQYVASLWSAGQFYNLPTPGSDYAYAGSINDLGQIVGYFTTSFPANNPDGGVLWSNLSLERTFHGFAPRDINNAGIITGSDTLSLQPQVGDGTTFTNLTAPAGYDFYNTFGRKTNLAGTTVGGANTPSMATVYWTDPANPTLGPTIPGYDFNVLLDINDAGMMAGYVGPSGPNQPWLAYRFDGSVLSLLPPLPGFSSFYVTGINNQGIIIGNSANEPSALAVAWEGDSVYHLGTRLVDAPSGFVLTEANAINDVGQIVGHGFNRRTGELGHVLLTPVNPVPEPGTILTAAAGLLLCLGWRQRRRP
jgi:PEP-CTERM motif